MRPTAAQVLVQVFLVMPVFLGGAVLCLNSYFAMKDAVTFGKAEECSVNVERVLSTSRSEDPLEVQTDGGDCARGETFMVSYGELPPDAPLVTAGALTVEAARSVDGTWAARPAGDHWLSEQEAKGWFYTGIGVTTAGALVELAWLSWVRRNGR